MNDAKRFLLPLVLLLSVTGVMTMNPVQSDASTADALLPPHASSHPVRTVIHGDTLVDPWAWLRERENPAVIDYLEAENKYTAQQMKSTETLQEQIYQEIIGRMQETDLSVPVRNGEYLYYSRTVKGLQYAIHCRKKGSMDAEEEVLIDENELAAGHEYFALGAFSLSIDQNLLAYTVDTEGNERYTLQILDLRSGQLYPEQIPDVDDLTWAADHRTIFYTTIDQAQRADRLHRHRLGTSPTEDVNVYHETDERFSVSVSRSADRRFIFLEINSNVTSEYYYLPSDRPDGEFQLVQARQQNVEYDLDSHGDRFFILTNLDAMDFRMVSAPIEQCTLEHWQDVVPAEPGLKIDDMDIFQDYAALSVRRNGQQQLLLYWFDSRQLEQVRFSEKLFSFSTYHLPDFASPYLRISYMSQITPRTVVDYYPQEKRWVQQKQEQVLGGYDSENYRQQRIWVKAPDNVDIPVTLVYRRDTELNLPAPLVLYGYGAYGMTDDPYFSYSRFSLLDRGLVYATAHPRGSGQLGRRWYEDGKYLKKKNTFTDFIACADGLVDAGYTTREQLAITGGSAGGLLIGAVLNMRPDLCRVAVADVPFVDIINTMLDKSLPLTVTEFEEWGNPEDEVYYRYMKSYSPYNNVQPVQYPDLLVTAGLNDSRVGYWEPAKWVARLRATALPGSELLLRVNMDAGHGGASGRYEFLREVAFEYAFILKQLGLVS